MSDKTPESDEFDELPENGSAEESEATNDVVGHSTDADASDDLVEPSAAVEAAGSGVRRKTAKAPVRKKDLARDVDPDVDDADIAALEAGFSDEENAAAAETVRVARKTAKAPVKKTEATRKRSATERDEADPYGPTDPVTFTKQSARELKQVVWPTGAELMSYFLAVLVFVLFFIAFIGVLDLFFGWGMLNLLGD